MCYNATLLLECRYLCTTWNTQFYFTKFILLEWYFQRIHSVYLHCEMKTAKYYLFCTFYVFLSYERISHSMSKAFRYYSNKLVSKLWGCVSKKADNFSSRRKILLNFAFPIYMNLHTQLSTKVLHYFTYHLYDT